MKHRVLSFEAGTTQHLMSLRCDRCGQTLQAAYDSTLDVERWHTAVTLRGLRRMMRLEMAKHMVGGHTYDSTSRRVNDDD